MKMARIGQVSDPNQNPNNLQGQLQFQVNDNTQQFRAGQALQQNQPINNAPAYGTSRPPIALNSSQRVNQVPENSFGNQEQRTNSQRLQNGQEQYNYLQKVGGQNSYEQPNKNQVEQIEEDEDLNEDRIIQRQLISEGVDRVDEEEEDEEEVHPNEESQGEPKNSQDEEWENQEEVQDDYDEIDREQLICLRCNQQVDQALVLQCNHRLCLECAAIQYKIALRSAGIFPDSEQLLETLNCESCGIPTPLTLQSIRVLLSLQDFQNEDQIQSQEGSHTQQASQWANNDSFNANSQEGDQKKNISQLSGNLQLGQQQQQQQQMRTHQQGQEEDHDEEQEEEEEYEQEQELQEGYENQPQQEEQMQYQQEQYNHDPQNTHPSQYQASQQSQAQQSYITQQTNLSLSQSHTQNALVHSKKSSHPSFSPNFLPASPASDEVQPSSPFVSNLEKQQNQQQTPQQQQKQDHILQNTKAFPIDSPFQPKQQKLHQNIQQSDKNTKVNNPDNNNNNDKRILYCFSCETQCFSLDQYLKGLHKNHNVKNVQKSYEELQEPIEDLLQKINLKNNLLLQDEIKLNNKQQELTESLNECKERIKLNFKELYETLKSKEQQLLKGVDDEISAKYDELNNCKDQIKQSIQKLQTYSNNFSEVYFNSHREVENEIHAFDFYAEIKSKILKTISEMEGSLYLQIRDKLSWQFYFDHNSVLSHSESIKQLKIEVDKLRGVESNQAAAVDLKAKFFEKPINDKSKKLLEHVLQGNILGKSATQDELQGYSTSALSNFQSYNNISNTNNFKSLIGLETPQSGLHRYQSSENFATSEPSMNPNFTKKLLISNSSPQKYIKLFDTSSQQVKLSPHSKITSKKQNSNEKIIKQQLSQRSAPRSQNNINQSNSFSSNVKTSLSNGVPFKAFSITSPSARQEFANILQSSSAAVKKYAPNTIESLILFQNGGEQHFPKTSYSLYNSSSSSRNNVLDSFRKNIDDIRKVTFATEESIQAKSNFISNLSSPSAEQQAYKAAQSRIRLLQGKFSTKY